MHDYIRVRLNLQATEILQDTDCEECVLFVYCDCCVVLRVEPADGGGRQWACVGRGYTLEDVDICVSDDCIGNFMVTDMQIGHRSGPAWFMLSLSRREYRGNLGREGKWRYEGRLEDRT